MGITEIAFQRLNNDELMEQQYSNPNSIIEYLCDKSNFRSLSSLIKETMVSANVCSEEDADSVFIDNLCDLLGKVNVLNASNDSVRKRVKRWIKGETDSIETFDEAIEICYALGLDIDQTNVFLNKSGFSSLSARNAKHAVHYYCILKKKSLSDAEELLKVFENAPHIAEDEDSGIDKNQDETTTVILWNGLNSDWQTDEAFLNSYLIPNKGKFIGYSKRALFNYYQTKNVFLTTILVELARNDKRNALSDGEDIVDRFNDDNYPLQYKLRSSVKRISSKLNENNSAVLSDSILNKIKYAEIPLKAGKTTLQCITDDTIDAFTRMKNAAIDLSETESQKVLFDLIKSIMTIEGAYKTILKSLIGGEDGRIRPIMKDSFGRFAPVMKCFPTPKSFKKYEDNPALVDSVLSARKINILMRFCIFCYEYSIFFYRPVEEYPADTKYLFKDISFPGFIQETNDMLVQSSLSRLYPPNQFDCMILMNVRKFETTQADEIFEPLAFFNNVLKKMFYNCDD